MHAKQDFKPNTTSNATTLTCTYLPPFTNSDGLWTNIHSPHWWLNNSLPLLELQLVVFCFFMAVIHLLLKRSGVSKISSQIIVCTFSISCQITVYIYKCKILTSGLIFAMETDWFDIWLFMGQVGQRKIQTFQGRE